ncbi:MAG TPA: hypothetical protein VEH05_15430, partial [Streptosporangiaceae bacterium]|nr:hypothetical protein [Streptosporangiaceae bacterium]
LYAALWTAVGATIQTLRIDYSPHMLGMRTNLLAMLVVFAAACGYLAVTRRRRRFWRAAPRSAPAGSPVGPRLLRPRSSRATAAELAPGGIWGAAPPPPRHRVLVEPEEPQPDAGPRAQG